MEDILRSFGAKCTKSVSKKTTYLVYGEKLEDGRPVDTGKKYQQAEKLGTKKLNFSELEDLIRSLLNDNSFDLGNASLDNLPNSKKEDKKENPPVNQQVNTAKSYLKKKEEQSPAKTNNNDYKPKDNKIVEDVKENKEEESKTEAKILWTTKHTPQSMEEIIGNQSVVRKLVQWLNDWDDVILRGNVKEQESGSNYYKGGKNVDNVNARAALISGPPGIGKTSTVRLLAKLNNYKTFELNASDQRNKGIINQKVGYLMNNLTLSSSLEESNSKNLIIMDEIDGMAGNEDRGGVSALIDIIKKTKIPIICICNDHQNQKLKTLIKYCYDLKFAKPDKRQVSKRLIEICKMEGFDVEPNAVEYLCESVGNDIRQCLNFLELWSRKSNEMKYKDLKLGYNKYQKDSGLMISNFSAAQKLLSKNEVNLI
jgi:replication factor C subunit 1